MIRSETISHDILVTGVMLLSTACLDVQHDLAQCEGESTQDRLKRSWRIQTDLNGGWEQDDFGQCMR